MPIKAESILKTGPLDAFLVVASVPAYKLEILLPLLDHNYLNLLTNKSFEFSKNLCINKLEISTSIFFSISLTA
jgi:hypothetical protein